jgi:hypothetical protein
MRARQFGAGEASLVDRDMTDYGDWQPIETAPQDGSRILIVIRASEQGPGEVDVARWTRPHRGADPCWVAADSDAVAPIVYAETEVLFWMPLPRHAPQTRSAVLAAAPSAPDPSEMGGSGI